MYVKLICFEVPRVVDATHFREAHSRTFAPYRTHKLSLQLQIHSWPCLNHLGLLSSAKRPPSSRPGPPPNQRPHQKLRGGSQRQDQHELQYSQSAPRTMNWPRPYPPNLPSDLRWLRQKILRLRYLRNFLPVFYITTSRMAR